MKTSTNYNPDVLTCLANLSNDEVFTPPSIVTQMLDQLPSELWSDKNARFLDPVSKTGVFLREIAARLNAGLELQIPDQQERLNHIYINQLFGLAITELTSLLSRRGVYCSKTANGKYSICTDFKDEQGNIRYARMEHVWQNGRCSYCGAGELEYGRGDALENYAYQFIHTSEPEKFFNSMKFDVIIGNPPYQLSDGGAQASATPIFQLFVDQAKKLNPRFLTMIIPARWYSGGKGLDKFRADMLGDGRLRVIHDYKSASDCFRGVEIKGGIMYFLWDRDNPGDAKVVEHQGEKIVSEQVRPLLEKDLDVFIRHNHAIPILKKILKYHPEILKGDSFAKIVSPRKPFGFATNFADFKTTIFSDSIKIYANKKIGYISRDKIELRKEWVDKWKVLVPYANNIGTESPDDNLNTIIASPGSCCTETYLVIGGDSNLDENKARNISDYLQTKFLRFLVSLKKQTQHAVSKTYSFVPMQDFSETWTDEKLYRKYKFTKDEIAFVDSLIRSMG